MALSNSAQLAGGTTFNGRCAAIDEHLGKHACLVARTRDHDPFSEKRFGLIPVQLLPEFHHLADDDDGRRPEPGFFDPEDYVGERSCYYLLVGAGTPLDNGYRRFRVPAVCDKIVDNVPDVLHSHKEHQRPDAGRDLVPVHF
jgi:hypothetical protein